MTPLEIYKYILLTHILIAFGLYVFVEDTYNSDYKLCSIFVVGILLGIVYEIERNFLERYHNRLRLPSIREICEYILACVIIISYGIAIYSVIISDNSIDVKIFKISFICAMLTCSLYGVICIYFERYC